MAVTSRSKAKADAAASATARKTRSASAGGAPSPATTVTPAKKSPAKKKSKAPVGDVENDKPTTTADDVPVAGSSSSSVVAPTTKEKKVPAKSTAGRATKKAKEIYCICEGTDDGTPMIKCEGDCKKWYHFRCVSLSEREAEDIALYICPSCQSKTGMKTVYEWEGPNALEEIKEEGGDKPKAAKPRTVYKEDKEMEDSPEEDIDDGSEDEYVAQSESKRLKQAKQRKAKTSTSDKSGSESDDEEIISSSKRATARRGTTARRQAKASISPGPSSSNLKRRGSTTQPPPPKKPKSSDKTTASDDPMRKYCLGKLDEVIRAIFLEYPVVKRSDAGDGGEDNEHHMTEPSTLTDDEKQEVEHKASAFVAELEECLFNTYSEPDKLGRQSAGGKYKERFRMLTFNLSKSDRIALRKGIASERISPSQLSVMSSADLANEQTKQEIQMAEKESLEHSILKKMTAPRAKITHKGLEDIEDMDEPSGDADTQKAEEERMERERLSRLRPTEGFQRTQGTSAASPTVPQSPSVAIPSSWGGPPPVPMHILQESHDHSSSMSPVSGRPPVRPLFLPSSSDMMTSMEGGLNLEDLINVDDDYQPRDIPPPSPQETPAPQLSESGSTAAASPEVTTPSGPSPFAPSKPLAEFPIRQSFDLNNIWTGKTDEANDTTPPEKSGEPPKLSEENKETEMDMDLGNDSDDKDFDMFLDDEEKGPSASGDASTVTHVPPEPKIEDLPCVWNGTISMPLDSITPLAPPVQASQIGGRTLGTDSPLWKTLFPSTEARIDGRVPVDKSSQYLLNTRLNVSKELIAVCFTPSSGSDVSKFMELAEYLIGKGRHALVFPWGHHPKPQAPGKELYIIPLLKEHPLPEYIEMLDDLRLPKTRDTNILLGVFVLNKGKLVAPPVTQVPAPPIPEGAALPSGSTLPSTTVPIPVAPVAASVIPSALAAEVASLTPEQIALMLRHLGQTTPLLQTLGVPPAVTQPVPVPPVPQYPPPGFPLPYQPPPPTLPPPGMSPPRPPPTRSFDEPPFDNYGRGGQRRSSFNRDEWDRSGDNHSSEYGRGGPRGRGRGSYEGDRDRRRPSFDSRTPDSGWSSRGRGGGPSRSPPQGRQSRFGDSKPRN
ncbi:hypothetical protein BD410DRAFT_786842 [Rickenella mellea]|uniref:Transcription factor BYE1 n=1 Tax=Rickenella mellea TaxID=50990 RepID=A0A4Y7Q7I5_9AGAM|nr:hypothetical protein BD410DRAFT_786842 [Rickenella mellea]